jgi:biopolymer transport protein ExbD
MDLIPDNELKVKSGLNLAPMVDFLFLVMAVFATIAITKSSILDSEIQVARLGKQDPSTLKTYSHVIHLGVTAIGEYKWITEFNEFAIDSIAAVEAELDKQQDLGVVDAKPEKTTILLHIDKKAEWEPVISLLLSLKREGYSVHPVYQENEPV